MERNDWSTTASANSPPTSAMATSTHTQRDARAPALEREVLESCEDLLGEKGGMIKTRSADGQVWVNGAKVVAADIDTSNGVIHVIDAVLLPQ